MMHHQGREHHIEGLIGKGEVLDHPDLELDRHMASSCFRAGTGDLLLARVNAYDAARAAHAALGLHRQRSGPAADIQHLLANLKAGEGRSCLPELARFPTDKAGAEDLS